MAARWGGGQGGEATAPPQQPARPREPGPDHREGRLLRLQIQSEVVFGRGQYLSSGVLPWILAIGRYSSAIGNLGMQQFDPTGKPSYRKHDPPRVAALRPAEFRGHDPRDVFCDVRVAGLDRHRVRARGDHVSLRRLLHRHLQGVELLTLRHIRAAAETLPGVKIGARLLGEGRTHVTPQNPPAERRGRTSTPPAASVRLP